MRSSRLAASVAALLGLSTLSAAAHAEVWGGFDTARVNYPEGVLTGNAHAALRTIITSNGDTIAGSLTSSLSSGYLNGIDVFYTSLLTNNNVPLTAAEQSALQAWLADGGRLIVSADIFNQVGYSSFLSSVGVTFTPGSGTFPATTTGAHPLVAGVSTINGVTDAAFNLVGNGTLLASLGAQPFAAAFDWSSGYTSGGCILIVGDHNAFTTDFINTADNAAFVANWVSWVNTCDLRPVGTSCTASSQCTSNACVDSVCCSSACGNGATTDCQACSVAAGAPTDGTCAAVGNGSGCSDGNACTQVDQCQGGSCQGSSPPDCASDDPCQIGSCDPVQGCILTDADDGTACSDGDACTAGDACQGGSCSSGAAVQCDDGETCTTEACDALQGCVYTPVDDGVVCDDGNGCTTGEACDGGACVAAGGRSCASDGACMIGSCGLDLECELIPAEDGSPCEDDDLCTVEDSCGDGTCVPGRALVCDDRDECTSDQCHAGAGCVHEALADGTPCGADGACEDGVCVETSGEGGAASSTGTGTGGSGTGGDGTGAGPGSGGDDAGSGGGSSTTSSADTSGGSGGGDEADGAADDGGCGCGVQSESQGGVSSVALLGLVAALIRRRRRTG